MPAGERRPPQCDPVGIHSIKASCVGDRRAPVGVLTADVYEVPRLSGRLAEVAIVEDECGIAGRREALCEGVEARLLERPEAVSHDDAWDGPVHALWAIEPAREG